jgi:hypothetical protein
MSEIDEEMAVDKTPVVGRELHAVSYICRRFGFSLGFHEPLFKRISAWCDARYGNRLNIDINVVFPVLIGHDIYELRASPFLAGYAVCARETVLDDIKEPHFNVLDLVDGLTPQRRAKITNAEIHELGSTFRERFTNQLAVGKVRNNPGFIEGFGDLQTASDVLFHPRPQLGASRWASLQAAEKFLKAWLKQYETPKRVHDLQSLAKAAETHGLPAISRSDLTLVQCSADVRYDMTGVTSKEAVDSFHAASRICAHIAKSLQPAMKPLEGGPPKP